MAAGSAAGHAVISPTEAAAGSYTVLTVGVGHGCEGSPTESVEIKIPEQVVSVTPTVNANWNVKTTQVKLAKPIKDGHGNEITERTGEVTYTAKNPLADDLRDSFELSVKLPDAAGETLVFPIVQKCTKGEAAWVQTAADGQDPHDLEYPAPTVTVLPASDSDHAHGDSATAAADSSNSDSGTAVVSWIAPVAGLLGLLLGGAAFAKSRKQSLVFVT